MCRYGQWGVCFTYATWFALTALTAAGESYESCAAIRDAVAFLLRTQLQDGGWGESYLSCPRKVIFLGGLGNCLIDFNNSIEITNVEDV